MFTAAEVDLLAGGLAPRKNYWASYHQRRQATDPQYRARKLAAAVKHKEKQRGIREQSDSGRQPGA
ncbi:MAG: hypothetical protein ING91_19300 [Rhodocyclaceae bacterium]|nr:hypothetical protein [Rhodocyclaceae bacterium]MCA3116381.1 hypothetical protein [Rhodocyclaceae bacterium]